MRRAACRSAMRKAARAAAAARKRRGRASIAGASTVKHRARGADGSEGKGVLDDARASCSFVKETVRAGMASSKIARARSGACSSGKAMTARADTSKMGATCRCSSIGHMIGTARSTSKASAIARASCKCRSTRVRALGKVGSCRSLDIRAAGAGKHIDRGS